MGSYKYIFGFLFPIFSRKFPKTKELVLDFRRSKTPCQSVCIEEEEIETVQFYKYRLF